MMKIDSFTMLQAKYPSHSRPAEIAQSRKQAIVSGSHNHQPRCSHGEGCPSKSPTAQAHRSQFCILELSKLKKYKFYYDYLKPKYTDRWMLLFTDTDSLCSQIQMDDLHNDMSQAVVQLRSICHHRRTTCHLSRSLSLSNIYAKKARKIWPENVADGRL